MKPRELVESFLLIVLMLLASPFMVLWAIYDQLWGLYLWCRYGSEYGEWRDRL